MSAPSGSRRSTTPLQQRSASQNNTLGIRIVPYSPPRLDSQGNTPTSQPDSQGNATTAYAGNGGENGSPRKSSSRRRQRQRSVEEKVGCAGNRDPAWQQSPSSQGFLLGGAKGESVTSLKLATAPPSPRTPTTSAERHQSYASDISDLNALTQSFRASSSSLVNDASSSSSSSRPGSRQRKQIAVHADKTFSLLPLPDFLDGPNTRPLSFSTVRTSISHEPLPSGATSEGRPSSPLTTLPDRSFSPLTPPSRSSATYQADDPAASASSPWNYRLVGGLRKVPKTPDLKQKKIAEPISKEDQPLPPLPESPSPEGSPTRVLATKASFQSARTLSTLSETTNYKIYGQSSPVQLSNESLELPSSSPAPNYEILGQSSPANYEILGRSSPANYELLGQSSPANYEILGRSSPASYPPSSPANYEILGQSSPANYEILGRSSPAPSIGPSIDIRPSRTADSNENYVLHGDPSPSSSLVTVSRSIYPTYSQESLVVPPLKPSRRRSNERFGYFKSRSRESLRTGSLKSIKSISSIISQESTRVLFTAPALAHLHSSVGASQSQAQAQDPSWVGNSGNIHPLRLHMIQSHPHQWSSPLSTVPSESEGGSAPGSRAASGLSGSLHYPNRRSGSGHSRHVLSISSSLAAHDERSNSRSHSGSDPLERPQPTYSRSNGQLRMVRDIDEHGDGLADLHQRPSRRGLSSFFSGSSSDRGLHSSSSSRSNSFKSSLPSWARFYYGNDEYRGFFGAPTESLISDDSRPSSSFREGSPNTDNLPLNIYNTRRRAREMTPTEARPLSDSASLDIAPMPNLAEEAQPRPRKMTSSIWSPHLRMDRRASTYSIWEPPSVNWSAESGIWGRRNIQVILFIAGFVFPFAWMIAAFLPLPPQSRLPMVERNNSGSQLDVSESLAHQVGPVDDRGYQSARWWRNLNRFMSILGLLILGAVVALVVVSVR